MLVCSGLASAVSLTAGLHTGLVWSCISGAGPDSRAACWADLVLQQHAAGLRSCRSCPTHLTVDTALTLSVCTGQH